MMISFFVLLVVGTVLLGVSRISVEVEQQLERETDDLLVQVDRRIAYILESTQAFSSSSLAINSLIDASGRSGYFPQAIKELSALAGIKSVVAFDFSGKPIATSEKVTPQWFEVSVINKALAVGDYTIDFFSAHDSLVIVAPIEYLETQQGGIAVEVNIVTVFENILNEVDHSYIVTIGQHWSSSFGSRADDVLSISREPKENALLNQFSVQLETAIPVHIAREPVISSLKEMLMLGGIGMILLIMVARRAGNQLADPIRQLAGRIHDGVHPCGPVGTQDELEILAESFDKKTQGLLEVNSQLEQRVEERTSQLLRQTNELARAHKTLEVAHVELQDLDKMKDEFISTVSHELRTPLTAIFGALSLVTNGVLDDDAEKRQALLMTALSNGERLKLLINDLLDMQKISSGNMELEMSTVAVNTIIDTVIERQEGYGRQFGVSIAHTGGGDDLAMVADEHRIQQVFDNLISNAIKFSPKNGLVVISAGVSQGDIKIEIRDHGKGVPDEFSSKIFTRFSQADGTSQRVVAGTGLGLNICKGIVEAHGGSIGYENSQEGGAIFWFKIPMTTYTVEPEDV